MGKVAFLFAGQGAQHPGMCADLIESEAAAKAVFDAADAVLTGVETRSSSPVRVTRGDDGQSVGVRGLWPVGEGAGYAGGIMSAATDGILAAEKIVAAYTQR